MWPQRKNAFKFSIMYLKSFLKINSLITQRLCCFFINIVDVDVCFSYLPKASGICSCDFILLNVCVVESKNYLRKTPWCHLPSPGIEHPPLEHLCAASDALLISKRMKVGCNFATIQSENGEMNPRFRTRRFHWCPHTSAEPWLRL